MNEVFLVCKYGCSTPITHRVFSTKEKAEEFISNSGKESRYFFIMRANIDSNDPPKNESKK